MTIRSWRKCSLFHRVLIIAISLLWPLTVSAGQNAVILRSFSGSPSFSFDADGVVGPDHYAEISNVSLRVTALATGAVVYASVSLSQFWSTKVGLPLSGCCFDPHLEYDHSTQRWFAISLSGQARTDSAIYLGISDTSDPSQGWKGLVIDADPSDIRWADYPYLGFDGSAVVIMSGMLGISAATPFRRGVFVLPKADLVGAVPTAAGLSRFLTQYPTTDPNAFHYDVNPQIDYKGTATDGLQIASFHQPTVTLAGSGYRWSVEAVYQRMTGQASGPATLVPWATTPGYQFDSALNPPPQSSAADYGRQPGTSTRINNGGGNSDVRIGDTVYSVTSAPVLGRLGIVWRVFQPSTNAIIDAGFIGDNTNDYLSPSISANARGEAVIAYARTGPAEFASLYVSAGRPNGEGKLVFGPQRLVKAGTNIYDETGPAKSPGLARFIDYATSVSVHPFDSSRFWISGPYVSARNVGSTWVAEVKIAPRSFDLDGDGNGDAFIYNSAAGPWAFENTTSLGTFTQQVGAWGPGWTAMPARFNQDALDDLFLFHSTTGQWFKLLNNGAGGWTSDGFAAWGTNWQRFVVDFNGDGLSDLFLWDPVLGQWYRCLSTPGGFTYAQGYWSPGWEVYPMRLNTDALADFFLFNRSSGQWFWATGGGPDGFSYPQNAAWATVWQFTRGDYNGDSLDDLLIHNPANGQFHLAVNTAGNFTYAFGTLTLGWNFYATDLDADGDDDLFLHNPSTGQWFQILSTGGTSLAVGGTGFFTLGWDLHPTDLNADGRGDLLLYNLTTGQWYQARNLSLGSFAFTSGFWSEGLSVVAGMPRP